MTGSYAQAQQVLDELTSAGVDYDEVVQLLEEEGLAKFEDAWTGLVASVTDQLRSAGAAVGQDGRVEPAGAGGSADTAAG